MNKLIKKIGLFLLFYWMVFVALSQNNNAFRFKITGNGYSDETIIRWLNGASQNFDGNYDAWKLFSPNPNVPSIYTQISAGQELSINALPEFSEDASLTIYTNIPVSGTYTINVEEIFALTPNYKISLTDISSSTHYRIIGDTALVFSFNAQQNSPSFTFNISTPIISSVTNESCINLNDGSLMINNPGNTDWNVQILNSNNNIIVNSHSNSSLTNYNNLVPGNYIAQIESKGIVDDFSFTINSGINVIADFNFIKDTVYLSEGGEIDIINNSQNAISYSWNFDDGLTSNALNPTHTYSSIGDYEITLVALNNNCISQTAKQITVLQSPSIVTSINHFNNENIMIAYLGNGKYKLTTEWLQQQITVYDISGRLVYQNNSSEKNHFLSLVNNPKGIYLLIVINENGELIQKKLYR